MSKFQFKYFVAWASVFLLTVLFVPLKSLAEDKPENIQANRSLLTKLDTAVVELPLTGVTEIADINLIRLPLTKIVGQSSSKTSNFVNEVNLSNLTPSFEDRSVPLLLRSDISTTAADLELSSQTSMLLIAQTSDEENITPIQEQPPQTTQATSNLAQKAQNPIANLISVPFQNNFNFNTGPFDETQYILNIQPVIPVSLNEDWLLITRAIVPLISQPTTDVNSTTGAIKPGGSVLGLGDINPQFFFVPKTDSEITWGIGPVFLLPTATDEILGTGKWGLGPTGVIVWIRGNWLIGALANQIWSVAGDADRADVNQFLLQPFINYSLPDGWTIGTSPIITANWNADDGEQWTVPIGISVSKLITIGTQPTNISLSGYYNVERPKFGPDWQLRLQFALLFPAVQ